MLGWVSKFPTCFKRGFDSLRPLQSIYLHLINLPFLLYPIFYIILIQSLQTFRNRRNTSPFCCK
ncbi:hypothetical protein AGE13_17570 [Escherichia coli]|nr:hypothetical protein [Escherichia coli]EFO2917699.1 hypothetical protein [Escherichia coli]